MAGWFEPLTVQQQMEADFRMDAANGMDAPITRRTLPTSTLKVTRRMVNEYEADAAAQRRHDRIQSIRNRNLRSR